MSSPIVKEIGNARQPIKNERVLSRVRQPDSCSLFNFGGSIFSFSPIRHFSATQLFLIILEMTKQKSIKLIRESTLEVLVNNDLIVLLCLTLYPKDCLLFDFDVELYSRGQVISGVQWGGQKLAHKLQFSTPGRLYETFVIFRLVVRYNITSDFPTTNRFNTLSDI